MKECAITCMGQLVAVLGDALPEQLPVCLQLLLERLRNEITRLAAVKVRLAPALCTVPTYPPLPPSSHNSQRSITESTPGRVLPVGVRHNRAGQGAGGPI